MLIAVTKCQTVAALREVLFLSSEENHIEINIYY